MSHSIDKKDFSIFKIGLTYIKDFEIFIYIINKNKDNIYKNFEKIFNDNYIIKIDRNIKLKCTEKKDKNKNENEEKQYLNQIIFQMKVKKLLHLFQMKKRELII